MKAAIIESGTVVNVARITDAEFAEQMGWIVSGTARIGDRYDNGAFITPEPAEPGTEPASAPKTHADLKAELAEIHDRYCSGTTPYGGIEISIDVEARVNAQGTLNAVKSGQQPLPFAWFNGEQSVVVESEADMQAIHDAIFAALQRRFAAKAKVLASIDSITDPESYSVEAAYHAHLR